MIEEKKEEYDIAQKTYTEELSNENQEKMLPKKLKLGKS